MKVPFVDLNAQTKSIAAELDAAMKNVIDRSAYILGPDVKEFEAEFAAFCESDFAVGVGSGTSALEMALRAFGIGAGDEVITAANTFIATALAITYVGAKPVFVDMDAKTYNIDVSQIEAAITPKTRAIIPVHLYGQTADLDPILEIAEKHSLVVIEDSCQSHGARYKGKRAGSFGDAAAFSFYPAKNLGAFGDGGMVVTKKKEVYDSLLKLRDYGQEKKYHHVELGYNSRLDTLQAAVLRVKLKYLDQWNEARRRHAAMYNELLDGSGAETPFAGKDYEAVYHLYVIQVDDRDKVQKELSERGVSCGIHYPIPIHMQPAFEYLGYRKGQFPETEKAADRILSLPMCAELTSEMVEYAAQAVRDVTA